MQKGGKILATIGVVIVFVILFTIFTGMKESGNVPSVVGLVIMAGTIGALRAIWKKDKKKDKNDDDTSVLQK